MIVSNREPSSALNDVGFVGETSERKPLSELNSSDAYHLWDNDPIIAYNRRYFSLYRRLRELGSSSENSFKYATEENADQKDKLRESGDIILWNIIKEISNKKIKDVGVWYNVEIESQEDKKQDAASQLKNNCGGWTLG